MKTVGILRELPDEGIVEIGVPLGVVAAILPTTNPTSTAMFKTLIALKAGNAIVLSVQGRIAELAVLQTLGYSGPLVGALIVAEGAVLAILGGAIGAIAALAVTWFGSFALSVEGQSIPISAAPSLLVSGLVICAALGIVGSVFGIRALNRPAAPTLKDPVNR